jgi:hypothetical protein
VTELFRVPRLRVRARVHLAGRRLREVSLFLSETSDLHSGHERPSDVLNAGHKFLPALDGDTLVFLSLDAITMVTVAGDSEYSDEELLLLEAARQQETDRGVEVVLDDGTAFSGEAAYVLPEGQRRIQDFLNTPERFFRLREGDYARLVNKTRVLWVRQE